MPQRQLPNHRLLAILNTPRSELMQWNYREQVQGWIYNQLGDIAVAIHDAPFSLFTFSLYTPLYRVVPQGLISHSWLLRIASAHHEVLDRLEAGLGQGMNLGEVKLQPQLVTRELFSDTGNLSSSPIITFDKETKRYQNPLEQEQQFQEAVKASLANRWKYYTESPAPEIDFKFTAKPKARKIQYKNRLLIGFEGDVELKASTELIQYAQCVG